jgi:hypothetical protein
VRNAPCKDVWAWTSASQATPSSTAPMPWRSHFKLCSSSSQGCSGGSRRPHAFEGPAERLHGVPSDGGLLRLPGELGLTVPGFLPSLPLPLKLPGQLQPGSFCICQLPICRGQWSQCPWQQLASLPPSGAGPLSSGASPAYVHGEDTPTRMATYKQTCTICTQIG